MLIRGEPLTDVLDRWLTRAEIGIAPKINDSGYYAWWTADDRPINEVITGLPPTVEQGGILAATDKKRVRPRSVIVSFPRQVEVLLRLVGGVQMPGESGSGVDGLLPGLAGGKRVAYNVLRLPDSVEYKGKTWHAGTWVTLAFAMEMWVSNGDPEKNIERLKAGGITSPGLEQLEKAGAPNADWSKPIRENYFDAEFLERLGMRFLQDLGLHRDPVWGPRIAELSKRYLQTWQIDPNLYRYVLEVRPERARVVSGVYGVPAEPYISADHAEIYEYGASEIGLNPRAKAAVNVDGVENPSKAVGVPARLVFEQPDVFTIDYDAYYSARWLKQTVPSKLVESTIPPIAHFGNTLNGGDPVFQLIWNQCFLEHPNKFKGFVILSMVFGTEPGDEQQERRGITQRLALTHQVEVPANTAGFQGETNPSWTVDLAANEDVARFGLNDDLEVAEDPVNEIALEALATAKARRYYHAQRDRIVGQFTVPGWDDAYRLFGSLRRLSVLLDEGARMSTTFDATQAPPPPDLRSLLPEEVRNQVFRELPRSRAARRVGRP